MPFGTGGLHEDLHDVVLFLRRAAVGLRLFQLAQSARALIAAGALAENGQRIGRTEDQGEAAVVAAHVVPELSGATECAAEQQEERERDEPGACELARSDDHRRSPLTR